MNATGAFVMMGQDEGKRWFWFLSDMIRGRVRPNCVTEDPSMGDRSRPEMGRVDDVGRAIPFGRS